MRHSNVQTVAVPIRRHGQVLPDVGGCKRMNARPSRAHSLAVDVPVG